MGISVLRPGLEPAPLNCKQPSCGFQNLLRMGPWLRGGQIDYKQHNRICRVGGNGVVLLLVVVELQDLMKLPKLIELCTQKDEFY